MPRPDDIRVLIDLGVAFMIVVGEKTQEIWAKKGDLRLTTEGVMTAEEYRQSADWLKAAQVRFNEALRRRNTQ